MFPLPKCVLQKLIQIQSRFLWSGTDNHPRMPLASWDSLQLPKPLRGVNVGNLYHKNTAPLQMDMEVFLRKRRIIALEDNNTSKI